MAANHDAQCKALLKLKAVLRDFFVLFLRIPPASFPLL
jgi:hypothetical protein